MELSSPPTYRLGATSYIVPADLVTNARFLADRVQDIELVLFQVDEEGGNLPGEAEVEQLVSLADGHDLSYTVHLPLDLKLGDQGLEASRSLRTAQMVIERTRPLEPWAYVLHLDGRSVEDYRSWVDQASRALEFAAGWAGDPSRLAVENLEGYPLDFIEPVVERVPVSRCVDIGHLWLDGHDPVPYLQAALPRTRVIHLHGVGTRDHQSLAYADQAQLAGVLAVLRDHEYAGVLTLEVFGREDFESSLSSLVAIEERR